nr:hypothetical protein [uncultured Carboxylicivirga sp.]
MKRQVLSILLASLYAISFAQTDSLQQKDFQFSFIYPLGTDGHNSINNSYNVSLNLFMGQTGATESFEAGSFLNINKHYTNGAQLSGFINITGTKNLQNDYTSKGFQGAGFVNVNNTSVDGAQIAGFVNTANKTLTSAQIGGFTNYTTQSMNGVQVAGFVNVDAKGSSRAQVAGFVNHTPHNNGAQIAGFINNTGVTKKGAQIAGFVNTSAQTDTATQVAGFVNVAARGTSNAQIAGFINVADKVEGLQLAGFINVCDSIDGVPIALISIVRKNGFRAFEVSASDWSIAQASFKLGVQHFYSVYILSKLPDESSRWAIGAGFGHQSNLKNNWKVNLEATVHQELWIDDDRADKFLYMDRTNLVNQLKFGIGIPIGTFATLNIAPTFNVGVAKRTSEPLGDNLQPHWNSTLSSHNVGNKRLSTWFGFSTGIQF